MPHKIVPLNKEHHAKTKIKDIKDFNFSAEHHIAYITMHEFARAAAIFPIVFLEDKQNNTFRPVVMMGLNQGENLFVSADGKWNASYVPAILRRYPFALVPNGDSGQYVVCIDEASDLVGEKEGASLFDEQGEPTEVVNNIKKFLSELQQMDILTNHFCSFLAENNMFIPLNMKIRENEVEKNLTGCYVINETRLNGLTDELFLSIKNKSYLPAIYAHLISLAQTERLVKFKNDLPPASI
jgi:hypothetical protein